MKALRKGREYVADRLVHQQFSEALRLLEWERSLGRTPEPSPLLLTPEGLRKIVALITRTSEMDTRDLDLLSTWVEVYRETWL